MRKILFLFVLALFSVTFVSWAYQTGFLKTQIKTSSRWTSGVPANVVPLSGGTAFAMQHGPGRGQKLAGIPIYKIELAKASYSELADIYLTVEQSSQSSKPLKGNWWLVFGVYYEVPSSTADAATDDIYTLDLNQDGTKSQVKVKRLTPDMLYLNRTKMTGVLTPGTLIPGDATNNLTLYIVASYVDPAGNPASGQQDQLNDLQFYCNVRI